MKNFFTTTPGEASLACLKTGFGRIAAGTIRIGPPAAGINRDREGHLSQAKK
jgi:hypothetical protein